jgi:hypothetical protein
MAAAAGLALLLPGAQALCGKDKKTPPAYALVTGTVFRETGISFPGVDVEIAAAGDSQAARKFKKIRVVTSPRGEFVARLPASPMSYTVTVKAPGYQPQEKNVTITADDTVDVFFRLEPESK